MTQSWVNLTPLFVKAAGKLTDFRDILDPGSLAPMDPFWVKFDPGVFRVKKNLSLDLLFQLGLDMNRYNAVAVQRGAQQAPPPPPI